ncbi:hypothetical protein [Brevundimonas sp.]|uniref:hypothetical protein n=1 Tax=Brevundimonas sp. TaxID=1871086 RepID=UPI002FC6C688
MTSPGVYHDHLEALRSGDASDPDHSYNLQNYIVEDWMEATGLSRRQICDVVAAWLVFGFAAGRLTFEFADMLANDLNFIASAAAAAGTAQITDFHTPLSWETYLAFDAGEFTFDADFDPVEGNTRPLVAAILQKIEALVEYPAALAGLTLSEPAATS